VSANGTKRTLELVALKAAIDPSQTLPHCSMLASELIGRNSASTQSALA
jgi:hypothetical protein